MCYKLMHLNLIYVKIEALKILAVVYNSLGLIFIGINNKIFVTLKYKKKTYFSTSLRISSTAFYSIPGIF